MSVLNRIKAAHSRLSCATRFTHNYFSSVMGFISYKLNKKCLMHGDFKGLPFYFRSADVEALNEVLVDQEYRFLSDFLKQHEKPVVLDIGHHIGTFSIWVFSQNKNTAITALEADPKTFKVAEKNAALGREQGLEWQVLHKAAWKSDEDISFSCEGDTMGHKVSQDGKTMIPGISLKLLMDHVQKPVNLMKLDIEGAEETFLAAHPELLKDVESMVIEIHPDYCSEDNVINILKSTYNTIKPLQQRETDKPLLWCYNSA